MAESSKSFSSRKKKTRFTLPKDAKKLVVIGNGMVGAKFCQECVRLKLNEKFTLTVIGDEPVVAYNRINLGDYVDHEEVEPLILEPREWYSDNNIKLTTGIKVTAINREGKTVTLSDGKEVSYDLLVIATGSRPTVPSIEGVNSPRVLTYRNLADLKSIIERFESANSVAILGGGLLGIEAAHTFQKLGVTTTVVQRANFLMTRQLNEVAGVELESQLSKKGIKIETRAQKTSIEDLGDQLKLNLDDNRYIKADYLVISAGITPNTEFVRDADIECGVQDGCIVDEKMRTNDNSIFAIGECASLGGQIYGLAAPGFKMAIHLAELLAGNKRHKLEELDTSTRLKMSGIDVSVIGSSLDRGVQHTFKANGTYRMLTVDRKRRIVGAMGIGEWTEYAEIHNTYTKQEKFSKKQITSFLESGKLYPDMEMVNPLGWADSRLICNCMSVTKGQIMSAIETCGADATKVANETKASTVCGSCEYLLQGLCGNAVVPVTKAKIPKALFIGSIIALLIVIVAFVFPPVGMADSVTSTWAKIDRLWRDNIIKQISGYTLLGVFSVGLLVSARKRLSWFNFGKYASWRFFHVAFGIISLIILFAHTGFHFGHNLNLWLMLVFTLLNLFGALSGVVIAFENTSNVTLAKVSQTIRPYMLWGHIILFWPLPILVIFHILSVYKY